MASLQDIPVTTEKIPDFQQSSTTNLVDDKLRSRPRRKAVIIAGVIAVLLVVAVAAFLIGKYSKAEEGSRNKGIGQPERSQHPSTTRSSAGERSKNKGTGEPERSQPPPTSSSAKSCLSCRCQPREPLSPSFQVDLKKHTYHVNDSNIAWVDQLKSKSGTCANQGKIRIRFDHLSGPKRTARIDLWFARQVTGFSFDIGDSPTVNGYGGDAGTTSNAAEVHGKERTLLIYSNVLPGYLDYTTDNHLLVENKANALSDHVTICISHERVEVTNHRGYQAVYDSKYLFVLDGGPITHPAYPSAKPETDIWLSMNRVIQDGSYRVGTGLCKVAISWV